MSDTKDLTKTLVCIVSCFFIFVILYNAYLYLAKRVIMVEEPVFLLREGFDAAAFKEASGSEVNQGVRAKSKYISDQKAKAKKKAEDDKKKGITTPAEKEALANSNSSGSTSGGSGSSIAGSGGSGSSIAGSGGSGSGGSGSSISGSGGSGSSIAGSSIAGSGGSGSSIASSGGSGEGFQGNQNCLSIAECQTMQTANDNSKLLTKLTQKVDQHAKRKQHSVCSSK